MTREYLVEFGRFGYLTRCEVPGDETYLRGDAVLIRSPRGIERGVILGPLDPRTVPGWQSQQPSEFLRRATDADLDDPPEYLKQVLTVAESLAVAAEQPVVFLDAESMLESGPIILHLLTTGECQLDSLLQTLQAEFARPFQIHLQNHASTPAENAAINAGCLKPGCGSERGGCETCGSDSGGGCSSGSCSRNQVHSADELFEHFRSLRQQMEERSDRRRANLC